MGVRASGISNQKPIGIHLIGIAGIPNTPEYGSLHSPMHGSIHKDTIAVVIIISFSATFRLFRLFASSKPFKKHTCFRNTTCNNNAHDR